MSILARVAAAATLAFVAACTNSGGHGDGADGLTGALSSVSASGPVAIGYTDLGRLRALGVIDARTHRIDDRWSSAASVGFRSIANVVTRLPGVTGVDLAKADRAVTVGDRGQAVRIDGGFDEDTVVARIDGLGPVARSFGGIDGYSFAGDDMVDGDSAIGARLPVGNGLNQIVVRGGSFAGAPNGTALRAALGGWPSLLEAPHYGDIAHCLGDVVAAEIWPGYDGGNSVLLAVGIRDTTAVSRGHDEVVCAVPAPGRAADVRASFARRLSVQSVDPRFLIPVSKYATAAHVDTVGPAVRATLRVRASADAGFVIEAYFDGAARDWDSA